MESQRSGRCEPCRRGVPPIKPVQIGKKIICGDCECVAFVIVAETVSEDGQRVIYGHSDSYDIVSLDFERGLPGMTEKDYE